MKIINPGPEDYHIHSLNYSDAIATVEEIVQFAGKIGLKKIAIADHSDAALKQFSYSKACGRSILSRWKNVHNEVEVIFGVEGDLLNREGDICTEISGYKNDFVILSLHPQVFKDSRYWTTGLLNAINQHADRIKMLGHLDLEDIAHGIEIDPIIECANQFKVALEFNCSYFVRNKSNIPNLKKIIKKADSVYVNSDAHTLYELATVREVGLEFLKQYLKI